MGLPQKLSNHAKEGEVKGKRAEIMDSQKKSGGGGGTRRPLSERAEYSLLKKKDLERKKVLVNVRREGEWVEFKAIGIWRRRRKTCKDKS